MVVTTPMNAANFYGSISRLANRDPEAHDAKNVSSGGADFGALIKEQVQGLVEQGNAAEQKQKDLLAGKADLIDVVTAVSETEIALETMVSVRDRVISAYEEIMRMPI